MDETLAYGKKIEFNNIKKTFKYIRKLGAGGTGDTHLLKDETTNMEFAFKKYVPKGLNNRKEMFERFVDEIKILFKISHPNIVRIYNYYLYSEAKLGYLQMEYISGTSINDYSPFILYNWENIFLQVISAFKYLEKEGILHRDIRAQNILIDDNENVKIIDFGFGKILSKEEKDANSVVLNWPYTKMPEEIILNEDYNHYTEIYFIGKLFENILKEKEISEEFFSYYSVLNKMTQYQVKDRYNSFDEVYKDITTGIFANLDFKESEKAIYQQFSNTIYYKINTYINEYNPITNIEDVIKNIAIVLRKNTLETFIQNNAELIKCFINNDFSYNSKLDIEKDIVERFYKWITSLSSDRQINVIENINNKLSSIRIEKEYDDLPF